MPRPPSTGNVTSEYGWRKHPLTGRSTFHAGQDIGWLAGLALVAPISGYITFRGVNGGHGNFLEITSRDGRTRVTLSHVARFHVVKGQWVNEGEHVAVMGSTGLSTGVHVHWEVWVDGNRVDPVAWLTSFASQPITQLDKVVKMRNIRNEQGEITTVGETTVQRVHSLNWESTRRVWGDYVQLTNAQYNDEIKLAQLRRESLK